VESSAIALASVATPMTRSPAGAAAWAVSTCAAGTSRMSAPAASAAATFSTMPPTAPTRPSASMVPVPATCLPAARSTSDSRSNTVRAIIIPADGPPMLVSASSASKGSSTSLVVVSSTMPSPGRSSCGMRAAATVTSSRSPPRSTARSIRSPGARSARSSMRSSAVLTSEPLASSTRSPEASRPEDGPSGSTFSTIGLVEMRTSSPAARAPTATAVRKARPNCCCWRRKYSSSSMSSGITAPRSCNSRSGDSSASTVPTRDGCRRRMVSRS
jgi:hypothetical protein